MKVAVYCRVSTDDQAGSKTIENQVDYACRYCDLNGLEVYDFYTDDGISGTVPVENRPAGSRMMADALRGCFGAVYIYRLDRLARTALDILRTHQRLCEANVALKSMTENFDTSTPSGKFFMTTLGGIAEIERETIAERMRLGKDRALREGRWPGGPPPYGYSLSRRRLVVNEEEAAVVRFIFRLYVQGGMGTASIADYLNATGVPSPGGKNTLENKRWHGSRVWSILSNPAYRGVFVFRRHGGKNPVDLECPPVVAGEEWEAAREARSRNSIDAGRNSRREYLLKGLIRCGICGRTYCGDGSGKEGRRCYYRCAGSTSGRPGQSRCQSRSVRADLLENIVWDDVCRFLMGDRDAVFRTGRLAGPDPGEMPEDRLDLGVIETALQSKEKERQRIIGLFRQSVISEEEARKELTAISREKEALEKRRRLILGRVSGREIPADTSQRLASMLSSAGHGEKMDLVRGLVAGITVDVVEGRGRPVPRVAISYVFDGPPGCALYVETRGKYRLGVPKSPY